MADEYCGLCKFHHAGMGECRRYAPRMMYPEGKYLAYHNSELLRDIAWTLRAMTNLAQPEKGDDLYDEAIESAT